MLREPQHERKIVNDIKILPFVLSRVEGLRGVFQQPVKTRPHGPTPADIVRICMIPLRVVVLFGKLKLPREEGKIVAIVQIRLTHGSRFDH